MTRKDILKKLQQMSDKQQEEFYRKVIDLDKDLLINVAMERFGIQFELAEHIVELAVGNKDLAKLSLAEASLFICNTAKLIIKGA